MEPRNGDEMASRAWDLTSIVGSLFRLRRLGGNRASPRSSWALPLHPASWLGQLQASLDGGRLFQAAVWKGPGDPDAGHTFEPRWGPWGVSSAGHFNS